MSEMFDTIESFMKRAVEIEKRRIAIENVHYMGEKALNRKRANLAKCDSDNDALMTEVRQYCSKDKDDSSYFDYINGGCGMVFECVDPKGHHAILDLCSNGTVILLRKEASVQHNTHDQYFIYIGDNEGIKLFEVGDEVFEQLVGNLDDGTNETEPLLIDNDSVCFFGDRVAFSSMIDKVLFDNISDSSSTLSVDTQFNHWYYGPDGEPHLISDKVASLLSKFWNKPIIEDEKF